MDKYELYFICKRKSNRSKIKVFFKHQETNHKEDMQHSEKNMEHPKRQLIKQVIKEMMHNNTEYPQIHQASDLSHYSVHQS